MSSTVLEHRPAPPPAQVVELLVLWQHPDSRAIIPIGRLSNRGAGYRFCYTRAAAEVTDFRPLPGLADLYEAYPSARLPAVVARRVMEATRADYRDYMRGLGLDPVVDGPWEQIVNSGGERAGDTLQFLPMPTVDAGLAQATFFASGLRHIADRPLRLERGDVVVTEAQHQQALGVLQPGTTLRIEPERDNEYDRCAAVVTHRSLPLGWVPQVLTVGVRRLAEAGDVTATVERLGPVDGPSHLRLVLHLRQPAPAGFDWDEEGRWTPLGGAQPR